MPMSELLRDEPDQPSRYETICKFYIGQIADGSIRPGELLPTAHRLAEQHGTSASTARRGLRLLADLGWATPVPGCPYMALLPERDRKSTRLNSSHSQISYAVFCLKKQK